MEVTLTINGTRKLILTNVDQQLLDLLHDANAEFSITLRCSAEGLATKFPQGETPAETIQKVRAILIESITPIKQDGR